MKILKENEENFILHKDKIHCFLFVGCEMACLTLKLFVLNEKGKACRKTRYFILSMQKNTLKTT